MATEATTRVLEALSTLYSATDRQTSREANRWLESFQKKPESWQVADYLLKAEETNTEARLFAAQTFKQKITYDLRDLDPTARLQLRDSLVELLVRFAKGPKAIMIQLCLAMADLAIQMLEWKTVVPDLVEKLGKTPESVSCLLEFLKVLPEEMNNNTRLPLSDSEYKERGQDLIEASSEQVLNVLTLYLQSSGGNEEIQESIFNCLTSWIRSGEVDIRVLSQSPLMQVAFEMLNSDALFDAAVDVVSEIIYETRDILESQALIERIYPLFTAMLPKLRQAIAEEDSDQVRGYCRLFIEAGEAYVSLIATHPEAFGTLLDGITECSAYKDLEIVPMTFKFWYELRNVLETDKYKQAIPALSPYFDALVDIMIVHLHYQPDGSEMSAEERDDFREFRHEMGDTIKDCCRILTAKRCLAKPLSLLTQLLSKPETTWQQIEAPIFSLRAMGSEVPKDENEVMPHIMEFLSKLPDHPKIRYAATLVISRYSFWTAEHPEFITYQLNFISAGFQNSEVAAAGALALKNLCKDCNKLLVDYTGQLHTFYLNVVKSLPFRDILEVTEAVSHVINVLDVSAIENALKLFCLPVAKELNDIVIKPSNTTTKEEQTKAGDLLEQLCVFFQIIRPQIIAETPELTPHPCVETINDISPVFDVVIKNYGGVPTIAEPLCKCFSAFMESYQFFAYSLAQKLIEGVVYAFEATFVADYLWVANKFVRIYGGNENVNQACFQVLHRLHQAVFTKFDENNPKDYPDVVEDYFRLVVTALDTDPALIFSSTDICIAFQFGFHCFTVTEERPLASVFTFYRRFLSFKDKFPTPIIHQMFFSYGERLTASLFNGLIDHFHQDSIPDVAALLKSMAESFPEESTKWMMLAVKQVPNDNMSFDLKTEFMTNWTAAVAEHHWVKVRRVLSDFVASYRRRNTSKDRP
ncbi:ARM repeat-containing protein [Backusella circina FSU 941]|nr:ARM repeat-containing protein [Backusella circina FSU 941]